jgi:hypothetical protein
MWPIIYRYKLKIKEVFSIQEKNLSKDKIPSYSAKWLVRRLIAEGILLKQIFKGTNLTEAWLKDDNTLISPENYLVIVNNALDESKDPTLGLRLGQQHNLAELGIWGYAIISSTTLSDAHQIAMQYWALNGSLVTLSYQKEKNYSTWRITPAFPMDSLRSWVFAVEELLSTFYSGCVFLSKRDFQIEEINLSYPEPAHGSLYKKMFNCPIYLIRKQTCFVHPLTLKIFPHPWATLCWRIFANNMPGSHAKLKESDGTDIDNPQPADYIPGTVSTFACHCQTNGHEFRTLRRRLEERNITYHNILDEIRMELTKEYIATTSLSIDQIANRLGFPRRRPCDVL